MIQPCQRVLGPVPAAFMRRFTFVVCAFLPAIRAGYGARDSDPDGRAAETSRPDRGTNKRGRSTTIGVGASTASSLREKASAANNGHPLQGMSAAGSNPVKRRRRCDRSFLRKRRFRDSYALE